MSKVYRFHDPTNIQPKASSTLLRKRRISKPQDLTLIAANKISITDNNGTRPIAAFRDLGTGNYVTLTRMESDLIALANPGIRPPRALEDSYPWLPTPVFVNNSVVNFKALQAIIRKYGRHMISARRFSDKKWNTVCNSIRMKNDLDARFYSAWHLPIQETFILEERRPERSVIALDFNSMYPACMQSLFPKPSALRLVKYNRDLLSNEDLPLGLFRCILHQPSSNFIRKHNPFRVFFVGKHLRSKLSEGIEVDLNEFEIEFFKHHFAPYLAAESL